MSGRSVHMMAAAGAMTPAGVGQTASCMRWRTADEKVPPFAGRYAAPANGKIQMATVHRPPAADCGDLSDGDGACGRRALSSCGGDGAERTCRCPLETLRRAWSARKEN